MTVATEGARGTGWKVKALTALVALSFGARWLAGHPALEGAEARTLGLLDWLVLTGLFCAGIYLAARAGLGLGRAGLRRLRRDAR